MRFRGSSLSRWQMAQKNFSAFTVSTVPSSTTSQLLHSFGTSPLAVIMNGIFDSQMHFPSQEQNLPASFSGQICPTLCRSCAFRRSVGTGRSGAVRNLVIIWACGWGRGARVQAVFTDSLWVDSFFYLRYFVWLQSLPHSCSSTPMARATALTAALLPVPASPWTTNAASFQLRSLTFPRSPSSGVGQLSESSVSWERNSKQAVSHSLMRCPALLSKSSSPQRGAYLLLQRECELDCRYFLSRLSTALAFSPLLSATPSTTRRTPAHCCSTSSGEAVRSSSHRGCRRGGRSLASRYQSRLLQGFFLGSDLGVSDLAAVGGGVLSSAGVGLGKQVRREGVPLASFWLRLFMPPNRMSKQQWVKLHQAGTATFNLPLCVRLVWISASSASLSGCRLIARDLRTASRASSYLPSLSSHLACRKWTTWSPCLCCSSDSRTVLVKSASSLICQSSLILRTQRRQLRRELMFMLSSSPSSSGEQRPRCRFQVMWIWNLQTLAASPNLPSRNSQRPFYFPCWCTSLFTSMVSPFLNSMRSKKTSRWWPSSGTIISSTSPPSSTSSPSSSPSGSAGEDSLLGRRGKGRLAMLNQLRSAGTMVLRSSQCSWGRSEASLMTPVFFSVSLPLQSYLVKLQWAQQSYFRLPRVSPSAACSTYLATRGLGKVGVSVSRKARSLCILTLTFSVFSSSFIGVNYSYNERPAVQTHPCPHQGTLHPAADSHPHEPPLRRGTLFPTQDTAHLLHPFLACEPQAQRQLLIRATGKQYLSWDDLLQYLEEDLSVRQAAKKLQHEPPSASEIHDRHCGEFARLLHAVRLKETNAIQNILSLPEPAHYLVCLEKQLLCYDAERCQIVGAMELGYSRVEEKLWEREEQRQQLRSREQRMQVQEGADKVELQVQLGPQAKAAVNKGRGSMLGGHLKSSVRGSSMSSQKSNDRIVLRKFNTESGEQKKRSKSSVIKLKNDDIKKVFELFEQASITNSLAIAHAFNDARANFHKSIVLDRSVLEKQPRAAGMELSAAYIHHDYQKELAKMRQTNKQLGRVRLGNSLDVQRRPKQLFQPPTNVRQPRRSNGSALEMQGRVLGIVSVSLLDNLLLVSLFNREVRLLRLKKTLNRITQECIFQRSFREVVTYVLLYRSPNSGQMKAVLAMEKGGHTEVGVWSVGESELGNRSYVQEINFSGRCQSVLPLGVAAFNESGRLQVVEVGVAVGDKEQRMGMSVQLINSDSNYRVSISQLRAHRNQLLFFLGCAHGYAYQVDRYSGQIKYQVKVTQSPVLDLALVKDDSELLLLFGNGNMALLSSLHLQRIFLYQAYGDISPDTRMLIAPSSIFYLYSARSISAHSLSDNQQKLFNNVKPIKVLQARSRLKQRQPRASSAGSGKVVRVVSGSGGEGECLSLVCEHGEIIVLDSNLQYVGSYFLLQAASLIDLVVSQALQFLAVLLDDYSLEVVNLYTQALLFSFTAPPRPEIYAPSPFIHTLHFFDSTSPSFFALVTGTLAVQHYSEKGSQLSATDLKVSCAGVQPSGPMIFLGEELALAAGCQVVVLHRKSYNRKCVVRVSSSAVVRLHRGAGNSLCGLDSSNSVFLVDLSLRQSRTLCPSYSSPCQSLLFSQTILLRHSDSEWWLRQFEPAGEWLLGVDGERELLGVVGSRVVRVSRASGRLAVLQLPSLLFRQFSL